MGDASPNIETESTDAFVGRTINDRFEILSLIARGGMGRVYKARQQPLGREVAIKVLDPRNQGDLDPEFQARFFLEASTSAKLSHPNTVTVFDYGKTNDDIYFIVMEYVDGHTLAAMLKNEAPLDPQRAVNIVVQIARSLREAHGIGVIHRDLKPANVLLTRHGDESDFVKVLDFGLVKKVAEDDELTQAGLFMGSPKYMAPEQIQGGDVDGRTDIYALGVILYLMLTGHVPFDRPNQVQILMAHMREAVPPMARPDGVPIPQGLVQVVLRCLAKDADARFANMNELIAALKHASGEGGLSFQASGAYSVADPDLSIARHLPTGTPGSGVQVVGAPLNIVTGSYSGIDEIDLGSIDDEPTVTKKKPLLWAVLAVLALVGGGAAAIVSSGRGTPVTVAPTSAEEPGVPAATTPATPAANPDTTPATGAAPTPATPPPVAETAHVMVVLRSTPDGAEVFVDDRAYGTTPASVEWVGEAATLGREVTFRFVRAGYRPTSVTRTIDGDRMEVVAELTPLVRRGGSGAGSAAGTSGAAQGAGPVSAPTGRAENFRDNPY